MAGKKIPWPMDIKTYWAYLEIIEQLAAAPPHSDATETLLDKLQSLPGFPHKQFTRGADDTLIPQPSKPPQSRVIRIPNALH